MSCAFCYKGNGKVGNAHHMSFATFKTIFDKLPHIDSRKDNSRIFFVTQIAFGVTSITAHPEIWEIFDYCRENGVIPNVTINGAELISDSFLLRLVDTCGSIAVSVNETNFERAVGLIQRMTYFRAPQVNIHYVISDQSSEFLYDKVLPAVQNDSRLSRMNAIVFLGMKPLRGGANYDILTNVDYLRLIKYCLAKKINFGFDSCSAPKFERGVSFLELTHNEKADIIKRSERCESFCFSLYINADGHVSPCSFGEEAEKSQSIDMAKVNDFIKDVWMSREAKMWRTRLFELNRECPLFKELHQFK